MGQLENWNSLIHFLNDYLFPSSIYRYPYLSVHQYWKNRTYNPQTYSTFYSNTSLSEDCSLSNDIFKQNLYKLTSLIIRVPASSPSSSIIFTNLKQKWIIGYRYRSISAFYYRLSALYYRLSLFSMANIVLPLYMNSTTRTRSCFYGLTGMTKLSPRLSACILYLNK